MMAIYTYRADGLRHSKTVNGASTRHVWLGNSIVLELDGSGAIINRFDRSLTGRLIRSKHHGYYLHNKRGDVVQRINAQGGVIRSYRYTAFGVELNPDEQNSNPFRFSGEYWDEETGTYYLRARNFNPRLGRFTQTDIYWNIGNFQFGSNPIERNGRLVPNAYAIIQAGNLFLYCMHNPVRFIDPSGLSFFVFHCSDFRNQAQWRQAEIKNRNLERPIYMFHITAAADFITEWNNMAAYDGPVFGVYIITHGHARAIWFDDGDVTGISIDGYNRFKTRSDLHTISELNRLTIQGSVHLFGCNAGSLDMYRHGRDGHKTLQVSFLQE